MDVEAKLKSKKLYKLLLLTIKFSPMVIALFYMLNVISWIFGYDIPYLSNIAGMSLITWIFMYLTAIVFKFCLYHRMFLWYILVEDALNIADYYWTIPVETEMLLMIHSSLIGIALFLILYFYLKSNDKNHKELPSKDS